MSKYKKKKPTTDQEGAQKAPTGKAATSKSPASAKPTAAQVSASGPTSSSDKKPKRLASGSLKLQFAGDLILVKNSQKVLGGLFKRYAAL